ncbi:unnamed protein product [Coffea canephora]|uniref:Uncharacterized protein n=1 Tax=Coffea canephora TaxID=49390 RepID=A0A068UYS5_COFCA|nr:unnamed protein product [Coffea canephora]
MIWEMGFVSPFFKPAVQLLLLQTLDFMVQRLRVTHMSLYFKGGKLRAGGKLLGKVPFGDDVFGGSRRTTPPTLPAADHSKLLP